MEAYDEIEFRVRLVAFLGHTSQRTNRLPIRPLIDFNVATGDLPPLKYVKGKKNYKNQIMFFTVITVLLSRAVLSMLWNSAL